MGADVALLDIYDEEEILKLSGRELDVLVAEARGAAVVRNLTAGVYWDEELEAAVYPGYWFAHARTRDNALVQLHHYHRDIYVTKSLLKELSSAYFGVTIYMHDYSDNVLLVCLPRCGDGEISAPFSVEGSSLEDAICKAFILHKKRQR